MAIYGISTPERLTRKTTFDIGDPAEVAVEALEMLGVISDRKQALKTVRADFVALDQSGVEGERYIQLPRRIINLGGMTIVLDGDSYRHGKTYPETFVHGKLWTPGEDPKGYDADDIGNLERGVKDDDWLPHARIAVKSGDNDLRHFQDQPFDEEQAEEDQTTQMESFRRARQLYEAEHEGFSMTPLNAEAVAMMALTCRIRDDGTPMPIERGTVRDATLPLAPIASIHADVAIGDMYTNGAGVLHFDMNPGDAHPEAGIGLSVGVAGQSIRPQVPSLS